MTLQTKRELGPIRLPRKNPLTAHFVGARPRTFRRKEDPEDSLIAQLPITNCSKQPHGKVAHYLQNA